MPPFVFLKNKIFVSGYFLHRGAAIIRENENKCALQLPCAVYSLTKSIKIFGKLFGQSFSMIF